MEVAEGIGMTGDLLTIFSRPIGRSSCPMISSVQLAYDDPPSVGRRHANPPRILTWR